MTRKRAAGGVARPRPARGRPRRRCGRGDRRRRWRSGMATTPRRHEAGQVVDVAVGVVVEQAVAQPDAPWRRPARRPAPPRRRPAVQPRLRLGLSRHSRVVSTVPGAVVIQRPALEHEVVALSARAGGAADLLGHRLVAFQHILAAPAVEPEAPAASPSVQGRSDPCRAARRRRTRRRTISTPLTPASRPLAASAAASPQTSSRTRSPPGPARARPARRPRPAPAPGRPPRARRGSESRSTTPGAATTRRGRERAWAA